MFTPSGIYNMMPNIISKKQDDDEEEKEDDPYEFKTKLEIF